MQRKPQLQSYNLLVPAPSTDHLAQGEEKKVLTPSTTENLNYLEYLVASCEGKEKGGLTFLPPTFVPLIPVPTCLLGSEATAETP